MGPSKASRNERRAIDAVVFDMDGVVTDTARTHFAAWKAVLDPALAAIDGPVEARRPFTEADYLAHVDGVPRLDGVRRLFSSRGLALPEGEDDAPGSDTVRGIAAAKNERFLAALAESPARAYPDAVALVGALKRAGVRVGIFSASRNAPAVLRSAGLCGTFEARLDGREAAAAGLPGKPNPAVPLETARRLGVCAARAALVEDAEAGVAAGAAGGFRLVVALDRSGNAQSAHAAALRAAGADIVVPSLDPADLCGLDGDGDGAGGEAAVRCLERAAARSRDRRSDGSER